MQRAKNLPEADSESSFPTMRLIQEMGSRVIVPRGQGVCGLI